MRRFNDWLAIHLGNGLSSMGFFYICVALDLFELPPVIQTNNTITWVTYLSQSVIQLIALPILGVQQRISHQRHEEHARKLEAIHRDIKRTAKERR